MTERLGTGTIFTQTSSNESIIKFHLLALFIFTVISFILLDVPITMDSNVFIFDPPVRRDRPIPTVRSVRGKLFGIISDF